MDLGYVSDNPLIPIAHKRFANNSLISSILHRVVGARPSPKICGIPGHSVLTPKLVTGTTSKDTSKIGAWYQMCIDEAKHTSCWRLLSKPIDSFRLQNDPDLADLRQALHRRDRLAPIPRGRRASTTSPSLPSPKRKHKRNSSPPSSKRQRMAQATPPLPTFSPSPVSPSSSAAPTSEAKEPEGCAVSPVNSTSSTRALVMSSSMTSASISTPTAPSSNAIEISDDEEDSRSLANVPDFYKAFLRVSRVWKYLTAKARSGQALGIDKHLVHRPRGLMTVYCPACPEQNVNVEAGWHHISDDFKHLYQLRLTSDGNHQCNKFSKNTDPDDLSLWSGMGYFPLEREYQAYLTGIPVKGEKSTCNFLNAVNKQDRKKFKNMDVTGIVNIQCDHVFVLSSVDMQLGERFANTDFALASALRQRPDGTDSMDIIHSYDSECSYSVKLYDRFRQHFPDMAQQVKQMRFAIPALHIQNHQESCMYRFSTTYMPCSGHFHGETAEHYWPELNQVGAFTRQMNNGHRQDTINDHHSNWNWQKTTKMGHTLRDDLLNARTNYIAKRDHFYALCELHAGKLEQWKRMDRTCDIQGKDIFSVYKHTEKKIPTLKAIYDHMITEKDHGNPDSLAFHSKAALLKEGIGIQESQRRIIQLKRSNQKHPLVGTGNEIQRRRDTLRHRLDVWRKSQTALMPCILATIRPQFNVDVEDETLWLPSDFTSEQRESLGLVLIGEQEKTLREGEAFDALKIIRTLVKTIQALRDMKSKNSRHQEANTRSLAQIEELRQCQFREMHSYECARQAMIRLAANPTQDTSIKFPPLTERDTWRKPTHHKRELGDSRRVDGRLWDMPTAAKQESRSVNQHLPEPEKSKQTESASMLRTEGWLWNFGKAGGMSLSEIEEWDAEGDRVQWFRAEAEMLRWLEQYEIKHVEFDRCIRAFNTMSSVWTRISNEQESQGIAAFARKQAHMYTSLESDVARMFQEVGVPSLTDRVLGQTMREAVMEWHRQELVWYSL